MKPLAFAVALGACFQLGCGLLDTDHSDIINPNDLNTPEGAQSKYLGAISDFTFAKDGDGDLDATFGTDGLVLLSGLMADEFIHATTPPSEQEIDQRGATNINPTISSLYLNLHRARTAAEVAAEKLATYSDAGTDDPGIPEMLSLSAYTYIFFTENFCPAVPYSSTSGGKLVPGPQIARDSALRIAIGKFDSAITLAIAEGLPAIENLARVGKARAFLNLDTSLVNMATIADSVVAPVPSDFAYVTEHTDASARLENAILTFGRDGLWSVADSEGGTGLGFRSALDPRVPFIDTGELGLDNITPLFSAIKYPDVNSSVPLADGIEARLIQAELLLRGAQFGAMNSALNTLRATIGLANLPVPATQSEAEDQLFSERGFWLYATAHRLGDLRRLVRQYGRAVDAVFPTGPYHKSGDYSTQVSLLIPVNEASNPNFNRALCDPTVP
jgi:hypothetical protein